MQTLPSYFKAGQIKNTPFLNQTDTDRQALPQSNTQTQAQKKQKQFYRIPTAQYGAAKIRHTWRYLAYFLKKNRLRYTEIELQ
ncbi:hypothetical protein GFER_09060 [Geoalkalibacter ferrihydriticus DSM 17813]|uniref:Uncharacterized protein n=1 Tax=Geoalkalibacter ferrihydriticus DSM 17813 TaxID=1121915 RepID=A0A0C2HN36_9BACT|nr:hypothetical protein GFER_09060 [Geoalkalibacter ferrihydriticus DSM 17813]